MELKETSLHEFFVLIFGHQDEECLRPGDVSDMTFLDKMEKTIGEHAHFVRLELEIILLFVVPALSSHFNYLSIPHTVIWSYCPLRGAY